MKKDSPLKSPSVHPIKRILDSNERGMILCKYGIVALLALVGLQNFLSGLKSLTPEMVYRKDFIQEYLLAKAVLAGVNPYLPCPELAQCFVGSVPKRSSYIQHRIRPLLPFYLCLLFC